MTTSAMRQPWSVRMGDTLRAVGGYLLSKLLSRHIKRVIFISSLYGHLVPLERLRQDNLAKLNELIVLAKRQEAMDYFTTRSSGIWKNVRANEKLAQIAMTQNDVPDTVLKGISEEFVEAAPSYLRYDRPASMVADVMQLIRQHGQLATA